MKETAFENTFLFSIQLRKNLNEAMFSSLKKL